MIETDLTMFRGDTAEWTILATRDSTAIDLTGGRVTMSARRNPASPVIFERTSDVAGGITIDPDQVTNMGKAEIKLEPEDTLGLTNEATDLFYTVRVFTALGEQWVVAFGTLSVAAVADDLS